MRLIALLTLPTILALAMTFPACTETPSYFPPCVDPDHPCAPYDAGADASDSGLRDAPAETTTADVP